jgi:hypothetical protein
MEQTYSQLRVWINALHKSISINRLRLGIGLDAQLRNSYFVTTDKGIFHISSRVCRLLTNRPGYGIAIAGDKIYFSYESMALKGKNKRSSSKVIGTNYNDIVSGYYFSNQNLKNAEILFDLPFTSNNGRIHQITYSRFENTPELLIAASEDNSIVKIDLRNLKITKIYPFCDLFGASIKRFDHNHINSVIKIEDAIYFVAYKAGDSSLIGYIKNGVVFGWQVSPKGYHDFFPRMTGFITCDTFGEKESGRVITENGCLLERFFEINSFAPRGVGGDQEELIIGHSHKGPRSKRFAGNGGLIIIQKDREPRYVELPASQIYQIIRTDGITFDFLEHFSDLETKKSLNKCFGSPMQIGTLIEEPIGV